MQLPFYAGQDLTTAFLSVEPDGSPGGMQGGRRSGYNVLFLLDPDRFGPTRIDAHFGASSVRVVFYLENPDALSSQITTGSLMTSTPGLVVGSLDLGGGNVEARATFAGDSNLDVTVDVGDLGSLATSYGISGGAGWSQGDFNYDGGVDVGDLGALATNYGQALAGGTAGMATPTAAIAAVPEPTSLALLIFALALLVSNRSLVSPKLGIERRRHSSKTTYIGNRNVWAR